MNCDNRCTKWPGSSVITQKAKCSLSTVHFLNICFTFFWGGGRQVLIINNLGNVSGRNTSGAFALFFPPSCQIHEQLHLKTIFFCRTVRTSVSFSVFVIRHDLDIVSEGNYSRYLVNIDT